MAASAILHADDHTVLFDRDINWAAFKTFLVVNPAVSSERPELRFPALSTSIVEAARGSLVARGLTESNAAADLALAIRVTSDDWGIGSFGRPNLINPPQGGRRGNARGLTVAFTEATLVIDLSRQSDKLLVWRGVFHDSEDNASKFGAALPKDATALLSQFPPRAAK
jgi:hypothetical protein